MTRPLTWLCLFVALGSGLFLYQAKHRAQLLDREITQVMKTADATRARSGVLQVEYQLLSDPQRLAELTASHLSLRPTAPGQFSTWADLVRRLPPVGLPTPNDDPAEIAMASADDLPLPPIPPGVPPMALAQMAPAPAAPSLPRFAAPAPVAPAPVALQESADVPWPAIPPCLAGSRCLPPRRAIARRRAGSGSSQTYCLNCHFSTSE